MINDFVTGKLGNENAEAIVPDLKDFLEEASEDDILKVFVQDRHQEDDPEMTHWGPHAMEDEEGAEIIPEFKGLANRKLPKRFYDAFYKTDLELTLKQHQIERVILTGVTTDICVQNTAAGAFYRDYDIKVVKDCTASMTKEKKESALDYMEEVFGAEIVASEEVIEKW
ncbi:MAG: cysteine hydrolase [Candidatus Thermoplasmatota archaeon]|nr:cysteine hydrolase [Candidatus Thermoplasmatota archaeon]